MCWVCVLNTNHAERYKLTARTGFDPQMLLELTAFLSVSLIVSNASRCSCVHAETVYQSWEPQPFQQAV